MKILLIPSAILIPQELRKKFGDIPSVLFPIKGATMLDLLYEKYKETVDVIYVIAYEEAKLISDYIHWRKLPIHVIFAHLHGNLGETIYSGITEILSENQVGNISSIIINFGDTQLEDSLILSECDFAYYSNTEYSNQWTFFKERAGTFYDLLDKKSDFEGENNSINQEKRSSLPMYFIGIFSIRDISIFNNLLTSNINKNSECHKPNNNDPFYLALEEYSIKNPFKICKAETWFDVGHWDNYQHAKKIIDSRIFNEIELDAKRGVLTKRSQNTTKFIDEISWYLKIPDSIKYLTPRIYKYSLDKNMPCVSMEYYSYDTLHNLLVFSNLSADTWRKIFQQLKFVLDDMHNAMINDIDLSSVKKSEIIESLYEMYSLKTIQRLSTLRDHAKFKQFYTTNIVINGMKYNSLDYYLSKLPNLLQQYVISNSSEILTIVHGDFCFSNILIDDSREIIRLIDPRGRFGKFDILGDQRYEIAKLLHSLSEGYDYIIEDLFSCSCDSLGSINIELPKTNNLIFDTFYGVFNSFSDAEKLQIKLIESTLFLSMIPLHNDHLLRQYAMLATGVRLLDEVIKDIELNENGEN